jgi:hypothetical protein
MVGMLKIDKEKMAKAYVEMGAINLSISEEYNQTELKEYLEMEVELGAI